MAPASSKADSEDPCHYIEAFETASSESRYNPLSLEQPQALVLPRDLDQKLEKQHPTLQGLGKGFPATQEGSCNFPAHAVLTCMEQGKNKVWV